MVAVFVLDGTKRCRFINAVAEYFTGVPLSKAVGMPFGDLVWRDNARSFQDTHLGRALGSPQAEEGEQALTDKDGTARLMAFRIVPVSLDAAEARIVELVDLGGETGTARALRESERRLRLATETTGIGIWDVNAVTGKRRWSAEFNAILGLRADAEPSSELFISVVHPEDRAWLDDLYRRRYAEPTGEGYAAEFRIRRAGDGAERWVATTGRITFDADGRALRGVGTLRDITAEKEAALALSVGAERLRLAVEANDVGTWDIDMIAGAHQWSPQFRKLWGLPEDAPNDPALLRALVDPADWRAAEKAWVAAADPVRGTGRIAIEYRVRRADTGERRWVRLAGHVFFDAGRSRAMRAIGIMQDTTAQKSTEDRQRRLLRELHHRVNNNLAVVQAILSQTVRARPVPRDAFDRVQARLMCLARIHELLSRTEDGEVSLQVLLSSELEFAGAPGERIALSGDPVMFDSTSAVTLGLVFHELASNAARHGAMSVPDGRIEIGWNRTAGAKPRLDITWREHGKPARAPRREGFGYRVIKSSVAGHLAGSAEVGYDEEGVRWQLGFALRNGDGDAAGAPEPARLARAH